MRRRKTAALKFCCRYAWEIWLGVGVLLELRGWKHRCHPTFSRRSGELTMADRCQWSPLIFAAIGAWFALHVRKLMRAIRDLPPS